MFGVVNAKNEILSRDRGISVIPRGISRVPSRDNPGLDLVRESTEVALVPPDQIQKNPKAGFEPSDQVRETPEVAFEDIDHVR